MKRANISTIWLSFVAFFVVFPFKVVLLAVGRLSELYIKCILYSVMYHIFMAYLWIACGQNALKPLQF